jgi:hypothetical protein
MPYTTVKPRSRWARWLDSRFNYGNHGCLSFTLLLTVFLFLLAAIPALTGLIILLTLRAFDVAWAPEPTLWHGWLLGVTVWILSGIFGGARVVRS